MKITLEPGESILHEQALLYMPPGQGKYNGILTITNTRLYYDARFDVSIGGLITEALFVKWGSEGYLEIPKSYIQNVEVEKSFLHKKCILTLTDGSKHTFDAAALGIDKAADSIKAGVPV